MHRTLNWLSALLLACVVMMSCRGGSNEMPVTVTGITPAAAPQGGTVMFGATVTGGSPPYTYAWTFTDIGTPSTSTSATPSVLITGDLGTETVSLVVTDSLSEFGLGSTSFDITDDAVTAVAPSEAGLPLGVASFEATTTGTPDSLAWDFGDGAEPSTSTDTEPEVTLQNPGTYAGTVTATFGGVTMPAFPFEYTVAEPVAPTWRIMRLGDASTQEGWINLIEHQARLTAIYVSAGNLICTRAKVVDPQTDLDWDSHIIGPGIIAAHQCVTSINGKLAIVYFSDAEPTGSKLRFAISATEVPASAADWVTYELPSGFFSQPGFGIALTAIDDERLMMAFASFSSGSGMRIAVSDSSEPTVPEDWANTYLLDKPVGAFFWPVFAVREADILLSVQETAGPLAGSVVRPLRTESRVPESTSDWAMLFFVPNSQFGNSDGAHDFHILDGRPWVVIGRYPFDALNAHLSTVGSPASQADWIGCAIALGTIATPSLAVGIPDADGRPAIAVANFGDRTIRLARSTKVDSTESSSWTETVVLSYGFGGGLTGVCSAVSYNHRIAVAVLTDVGARIAIANGPY